MAKSLKDRLRKAFIEPMEKAMANFNKQMNRGTFKELEDEVRAQIKRGISPVDGAGKFPKYSASYLQAIKDGYGDMNQKRGKRSPVDMTLSGDMLKSLKVVPSKDGVRMEFTGSETGERAYFHNNSGAGKSRKIRRLLPTETGERFNQVLQNKFKAIVKRIVKGTRIK